MNAIKITIEFSLERDENDINMSPDDVCNLVESIVLSGAAKHEAYINKIYAIHRSEEDE